MTTRATTRGVCRLRACPRTGRLLVTFAPADPRDPGQTLPLLRDWVATFCRPRKAIWRKRERCWSLPSHMRAAVEDWSAAWDMDVREVDV